MRLRATLVALLALATLGAATPASAASDAPGSTVILVAQPTTTTMNISWTAAAGADHYRLGWTETPGGRVWDSTGPNYTGTGPVTLINLVAGQTYSLRVTPYNDAGDGPTATLTVTLRTASKPIGKPVTEPVAEPVTEPVTDPVAHQPGPQPTRPVTRRPTCVPRTLADRIEVHQHHRGHTNRISFNLSYYTPVGYQGAPSEDYTLQLRRRTSHGWQTIRTVRAGTLTLSYGTYRLVFVGDCRLPIRAVQSFPIHA